MYVVIFEQKIFSLSQFLLSLFSKASKNHFFQIINPSSLSLSIWNNQFSLIKFAFQILKAVRMFCLLSPISIYTWMQVFSEHQLGFGIHSLYWSSHLSQVLGGKLSANVSTCRGIIFVFHIFPSALAFCHIFFVPQQVYATLNLESQHSLERLWARETRGVRHGISGADSWTENPLFQWHGGGSSGN